MPANDSKLIRGARALAKELGVSHTTVNAWLKDDRWTFGPGPWSAKLIGPIEAWRKRYLAPDPNTTPPARADDDEGGQGGEGRKQRINDLPIERQMSILLKKEKIETEKLNRQIKLEKLHSVDECRRRRLKQIHTQKQDLLGFADSLPKSVSPEIKRMVHQQMLQLLGRWAAAPAARTLHDGGESPK